MAEFPALTLWTDSYLADTRMLSTLEHGAYLLLLMESWRRPHCDLPDDDKILARLAGLARDEWDEIKPTIMGFWTYDGRSKTWHQKRLRKERDAARVRSKSAKDKAAKRWDKTKKNDAGALLSTCPEDASTATAIITTEDTDVSSPPVGPPAEKSKVKRATALPQDFAPILTPRAQSIVDGWPPGRFEAELRRFKDHAADKGRTSKDWQAALRTWIDKADEWIKRNGTGSSGQPPHNSGDGFSRAIDRRAYSGDAEGLADEPDRSAVRAGEGDSQGALALPAGGR